MLTDQDKQTLENAADLLEELGHAGCEVIRRIARAPDLVVVTFPRPEIDDEIRRQILEGVMEARRHPLIDIPIFPMDIELKISDRQMIDRIMDQVNSPNP
jgi:hypothetical protein